MRARPRLLLRAAPGAGKTTRVPAALLDAGLAGERHVLVLEPRRIAARAAAAWVARERGGALGDEVGYRVRFEQRGGAGTRLWFVTEGVFGRRLARDPFLDEAGVVVLDEFHERHLDGDLALAVVRHLQDTVRPDLRLVVMSATAAVDPRALAGPAVVEVEGRSHPVRIEHDETPWNARDLPARVAATLRRAVSAPGDVLVFLPGAAEIQRTAEAVAPIASTHGLDVVPLHGDLVLDAQERALHPSPRRRVVLATNVAETALTVEGVTTVIDGGLARVARFDPRHGINVLRVQPVSRAAAEQRAGRAGRTAPGRCVRLWSRAEHAARRMHEVPEILRLELSRLLLELRAWGLAGPRELAWLDSPPDVSLAGAERLLALLGALGENDALTPVGERMLAIPAPPRLARVLVEAARAGSAADGALVAALAGERDILSAARAFGGATRDFPPGSSDLLLRVELFQVAARRRFTADACRALGLEPRAVHAVERARRQLAAAAGGAGTSSASAETLLRATLAGFPDRVVRRRAPGSPRAVMVGGTGVVLAPESVVREAMLFVAVDLERGGGADARVRVASAIEPEWLRELFPGAIRESRALVFDAERARVVERVETQYHDLVLAARVRTDVDRTRAGEVLAEALAGMAPTLVGPSEEALLARIAFLRRALPELDWPADLDALVVDAVRALCAGRTSVAEVQAADVAGAITSSLASPTRAALARDAPLDYTLPSGRRARIRYAPDRPPAVAARIQELFGLAATPRLARGRVALVVELLAPNQRPVQVTDDLASFWCTTYAQVRKELRGRYPRHDWPEDPTRALPTSRPRRRSEGDARGRRPPGRRG
ncbi:MAG TPA: ATP-dependent helicase HrpB [Candidatus Binatia bacterium]|nr:ATP-dependent helicase HrpB [Candidatus Binatia bacterium]